MALTLNGSTQWPSAKELQRLGETRLGASPLTGARHSGTHRRGAGCHLCRRARPRRNSIRISRKSATVCSRNGRRESRSRSARPDLATPSSTTPNTTAPAACTVIVDPAFGFSSVCGTTRFGSANVFSAFRSGPVIVSNAVTLVGVRSCQTISRSRAFSRSRFNTKSVAVFFSSSCVTHHVELRHIAKPRNRHSQCSPSAAPAWAT